MIIKTRFDVGQKVWILVPPKTPRGIDGPYEVYQIATLVRAGAEKTGYFLSHHNHVQRRFEEDDLYGSVEMAEQTLDFLTSEEKEARERPRGRARSRSSGIDRED